MQNIPQPFGLADIRKYTKEVLISLLIGFLTIAVGVIYKQNEAYRADAENCSKKTESLYAQIIKERNDRVKLYEQLIFTEKENKALRQTTEVQDSLSLGLMPIAKKILRK